MSRKLLLSAALLLLAAAAVTAQAPTSHWNNWQPAMAPDGSAHPAIQFRWRSDPPCTDIGCRLAVEIRNTSHEPMRLRCWVYVDPPPTPYEDEARPVLVDVRLERSGSRHKTGDTTSPLIIPGIRITGVVVAMPK